MILEEVKQNLNEIMSLLEKCKKFQEAQTSSLILEDYFKKIKILTDKFKHWNPEIFIYVVGGVVESVHGNCKTVVNILDEDAVKVSDSEIDYHETIEEWNHMIESSVEDETLIKIL